MALDDLPALSAGVATRTVVRILDGALAGRKL